MTGLRQPALRSSSERGGYDGQAGAGWHWLVSGGRVWIIFTDCGARLRPLGADEAAVNHGPLPRCPTCARAAAETILAAAIGHAG